MSVIPLQVLLDRHHALTERITEYRQLGFDENTMHDLIVRRREMELLLRPYLPSPGLNNSGQRFRGDQR